MQFEPAFSGERLTAFNNGIALRYQIRQAQIHSLLNAPKLLCIFSRHYRLYFVVASFLPDQTFPLCAIADKQFNRTIHSRYKDNQFRVRYLEYGRSPRIFL